MRAKSHSRYRPTQVKAESKAGTYPDFAARRQKIFGDKILKVSGAQLVAEERDKMSPRAQARARAKAEKLLREMFHQELAAVNRKYARLLRRLGQK